MSDLIKNGAVSAKIKAKKGRLLNNNDYNALCSLDSVAAIASYLNKTKGYNRFVTEGLRGEVHRDALENMIYLSLIDDFDSLYIFSKGPIRDFLELYYLKRETWIIKSAIYAVKNEDKNIHISLPSHSSLDSKVIESAKSIDELVKALNGTHYRDIIEEGGSIFEIETNLDKYYFNKMFETINKASKSDKVAAKELIGSETDATNILWIYRAKKYYQMTPKRIKNSILNYNYRLTKEQILNLIEAPTAESIIEFINTTTYCNLLNCAEHEMGEALSMYLFRVNSNIINKYPYSAVSALAYMHLKRMEIQNITVIIECVRYGMPQEEAYRHVIKEGDKVGNN